MTPSRAAQEEPTSPRTDLWWWLRGSGTRRMFARALGGGEHPSDEYLRMATKVLDAVANEVEQKPWKGALVEREAAAATPSLSVERLALALMSDRLARVARVNGGWEWWADGPDVFAEQIVAALARLDEGSATPESDPVRPADLRGMVTDPAWGEGHRSAKEPE